MPNAAITFDIDYGLNYTNDVVDEMDLFWPYFQQLCSEIPSFKSTWFIRIDSQLEKIYGEADVVFKRHSSKIDWLRDMGHELGWHFHSYKKTNQKWVQNMDSGSFCAEIHMFATLAQKHQLEITRMGWGYQTNASMEILNTLQFRLDSSALPKNNPDKQGWSATQIDPYYPSKKDYRYKGIPAYDILEVPITMVDLPLKNNVEKFNKGVLDPALQKVHFDRCLNFLGTNHINTITHPKDILKINISGSSLFGNVANFKTNIHSLLHLGFDFQTLTAWCNTYNR